MKGIVKFFSREKGWGFIEADDKSYFIHHQNMAHEILYPGQVVEFEVIKTATREDLAVNVIIPESD